ncbi:MAG: hypothetical protein FWE91_05105 [Defluviitaleaceae bacterium]|nr:hypothetical protein [Defluviitaleaceae bacterium]
MSKKTIIKLVLARLEAEGAASLTLQAVGGLGGVSMDNMRKYFPNGDEELLMDAVELAGQIWIKRVADEVSKIDAPDLKIRRLAALYAFGTLSFPESLSIYIDLWKLVKNGDSEYIKKRLKAVYLLYSRSFCELAFGGTEASPKAKSLAIIMTMLSDMLHIQYTLLGNEVEMAGMRQFVEDIAVFTATEESHA